MAVTNQEPGVVYIRTIGTDVGQIPATGFKTHTGMLAGHKSLGVRQYPVVAINATDGAALLIKTVRGGRTHGARLLTHYVQSQ